MKDKDLVPQEEWPYELPEGWQWVRLSAVADVVTGSTPSKKIEEYYGGTVPFFKPADLDAGRHVFVGSECLSEQGKDVSRVIPAGSTAVCCIGSIGKCGYLEVEGTTNQQINSLVPKENSLFVYYFATTECFVNQLLSKSSATTIAIVNKKKVESCVFPLPSPETQQRIVNRIESLFAKLDEAADKVQSVLDGFETRKAAILHKAFTGELTAKWRAEHGVGMESWENTSVKEACTDIKVGIVIKPSQYYTSECDGIPAFRSANVREFYVNDIDWVYLNPEGHQKNARSIVHSGDVLIVRSGNPGTACVVTEAFDGYNAIDILIAVPDKRKLDSMFLCAYTNSPECRHFISSNKRGMALAHFNVGGYSKVPIWLPTLGEQQEIVRLLDELLSKEQSAKEAAEAVLEQIGLMRKAILAKAFRGEL